MLLSVISPVYRSRDTVRALYEQISLAAQGLPGVDDYEIVLVEDCGGDGSWEAIEEIAAEDKRVRAVQLSRNYGQHHAITAGLDLCRGDWAVVMDCDLQDRPGDIAALWRKAQEGYDVVNARREARTDSAWRMGASRLFHALFEWLSGLSYDPRVANFRMISRRVIDAYRSMREVSRSFGAQVQWLGFETAYIDVTQDARHEGRSSYTLGKLLRLAADTAISYSNKPLRFSVGAGLLMAVCAAVATVYVFIRTLVWGIPVPGWASLMVSLWFIGGILMANMGILGIYIGKIYDEARGRPIYVISKRANC